MKPVTIVGIVIILLGVAGFFVGGVSVKDQETKAQIGNLKITAETQDLSLANRIGRISLIGVKENLPSLWRLGPPIRAKAPPPLTNSWMPSR